MTTGAVAGLAACGATACVLLLVDLVRCGLVSGLFGFPIIGTRYSLYQFPYPAGALPPRLASAILAPWNGVTHAGVGPPHSAVAFFGADLVFAAVVAATGVVVRRCVRRSPGVRALAVLSASLATGALVAVSGAILRYDWPMRVAGVASTGARFLRPGSHWSHGPLSFGVAAFLLALLLGAFAFGLVGCLPAPYGRALRHAGIVVGACFMAFGLLFAVFVVSDRLPGASLSDGLGQASMYSSAVGGMALPLAMQAPVSIDQSHDSPFLNPNATTWANTVHWTRLVYPLAIGAHPRGPHRLLEIGGLLGGYGRAAALAIALAVAAGLAWAAIALCKGERVSGPLRGVRLGALQGLSIGLLAALVGRLTSRSVGATGHGSSQLGGLPARDLWGTPTTSVLSTLAAVVALCALAGAVYGLVARRDPSRA